MPHDDELSRLLLMLEEAGFSYQILSELETSFRPNVFQDVLIYGYRDTNPGAAGTAEHSAQAWGLVYVKAGSARLKVHDHGLVDMR